MNLEDVGKTLIAFIITGGLAYLFLKGQAAMKNRKVRNDSTATPTNEVAS